MDVVQLGNRLKKRREFLQLRQEDLAELSGIAIKTIHVIEAGTGNPSVKTLYQLLKVLGMELEIQVKQVGNE